MSSSSYKSCGCGGSGKSTKQFGITDCCNIPIQPSPEPCCVSHDTVCLAGVCLKPTCNVVASTDGFFLSFSNICPTDTLPIDANNIYFFFPTTGLMRVVGYDGISYKVQLVDPTKAGGVIRKDDCVLIQAIPQSVFTDTSTRCLTGKFLVPAVNQNETIYIENGAGIPIGATITFTYEGETGSYQVISFVSSSGNVYAYEVQNTGNGHTPGIIVDGGCVGECIVPIDIITEVDLCDLAETNIADSLTACVNGSPRGFTPVGEGSVPYGEEDGTWGQRTLNNLDCCVILDGCLKFSGTVCPSGQDTVVLKDVNLACFEAAWQEVLDQIVTPGAAQTKMPVNINGFKLDVEAYDFGTRQVTLSIANPDALNGGATFEFDEGTELCLGDCCESCLDGPLITNHKTFGEGDPELAALYTFNTVGGALAYETGVKHRYLVGFEFGTQPLTITVLTLTDTYNDNPQFGIGKPIPQDPLLFRNKICHDSTKGCDQQVEIAWNHEIVANAIPYGVRVHYEFGHFVQSAAFLADGTTPNPFFSVSSQACDAGYLEGPSSNDSNDTLLGTSIGFGGPGQDKIFPMACGYFMDYIYLQKCNCAFSVVWLYVESEVLPGFNEIGTFDVLGVIRQRLIYFNANEIQVPRNNPVDGSGWNT